MSVDDVEKKDEDEKIIEKMPKPKGEQLPEGGLSFIERKYYNPEKEIKLIWYILLGLVVFVVISFLLTFFQLVQNFIKDKELMLKYYDVYEGYSQKNSKSEERINELKIQINNLENEIKLLRAKNSYLK